MSNDLELQLREFDAKKVSFGRAQTFPLRLGWLPKVCDLAQRDGAFDADELIAEWGVGKNMVVAMRHWAEAANVVRFIGGKPQLTALGKFIFDGNDGIDPYLEDDATLWLLHWHINSRPEVFTAGFWFFNRFVWRSFSEGKAAKQVVEQLHAAGVKSGENAAPRDIGALLRMYCRRGKTGDEESLATPFPGLGLVIYDDAVKEYRSEFERRDTLPPGVVGLAAAQLLQAEGGGIMSVRAESANRNRAILEYVFRLDGDSLLEKLTAFCKIMPVFQLRQTAGVWQLSLSKQMPPQQKLLQAAYQSKQ